MSAPTPSRERTIGRKLLSDPLLAEALEAFAESDFRAVPNATDFLLRRVLLAWGWLAVTPTYEWVPGPRLLSHRQRKEPEEEGLAVVVPLARSVRENIA